MLKDLLIDESKIDEELLERLLTPFVRFGEKEGTVRFTPAVAKLGIKEKILLFFVAQKAKRLLGFKEAEEKISPGQFEKELGIKGSSIRPTLKRLKEEGFIESRKGSYWLENHMLPEIEKLLSEYMRGGE